MIFLTNNKNFKSQQGVTLLLAILVLSSVLAISFSLATILLVEVRTSGDVIRTEDAWYGVSAISEEAIFNIKRNLPSGALTYDSQLGNVALTTNYPSRNDNIIQISVPPNSTFSDTANHYPIFDPNCPAPNPNPDPTNPDVFCRTNTTGGSGYGKVRLTYLNTGNIYPLSVYLCQFDPTKGVDASGANSQYYNSYACSNVNAPTTGQPNYWLTPSPNGYPLAANNSKDFGSAEGFDPTQQQELIFVNNSDQYIYVQVESFAADQVTRQGLPFFAQKVVDISGANAGIDRKLRIQVPIFNNTSNCAVNVYAHCRKITVTGSVAGGTLSNFPMLVTFTDSTLKTVGNGGNVQNSNGYDIVFTQNSDGSGMLNSEIESYNGSTGSVVAWVNVPSLSTGTAFYMFYDKPGVSGPSNPPSAVWSNSYVGVWHFPNGTTLSGADSTGFNNAALTGVSAATGQVDGAASFAGSSSSYGTYAGTNFPTGNTSVTISTWVKINSLAQYGIIGWGAGGTDRLMYFGINPNGQLKYGHWSDDGAWTASSLNTGTWYYVTYVHNGTTDTAYINGVTQGDKTVNTLNVPGSSFSMGYLAAAGLNIEYLNGYLDELRVSNIARSANWIATEYSNESTPSSFINVGPQF